VQELLLEFSEGFHPSGKIEDDVRMFLRPYNLPATFSHLSRAADLAEELGERFGVVRNQAKIAAWLHDISVVIPNKDRIAYANSLEVEILKEEEIFPMLLHQKLSAVIAREVFLIQDEPVLDAIRCHTTLRPGASPVDQVVFIADKISWDQPGDPPYLHAMQAALVTSLDHACLVYLDYLWAQRARLPGPLHPWAITARGELHHKLGIE
jgi:predicted HD superfamily hydrolase involved in NAD metabolism